MLDSLIGRYKITIRSKKLYIRIGNTFGFSSDQCLVTLQKNTFRYKGVSTKNVLSLTKFCSEVSMTHCQMGKSVTPKRGKPSSNSR